jgi:hypothetical protein
MPMVSGIQPQREQAWIDLHPFNLNFWLRNVDKINYFSVKEKSHAIK